MSKWKLIRKQDANVRMGTNCHDCRKPILNGSFAKIFHYSKQEDTGEKFYKRVRICEECEKYYRRDNEPRM